MSESTFEIRILEMEIIALKAELKEAHDKLGSKSTDGELVARLEKHILNLKDELKITVIKNKQLENTNRQLQDKQMTDEQRSKISNYAWLEQRLRDVKNGALEKKIAELHEIIKEIAAAENQTLRKYISEQTANEKLRQEINILNGRLSSPYTRGIHNYWKNRFIAAGIVLVFSFLVIFGLILKIT